jgi:hypothetical protein
MSNDTSNTNESGKSVGVVPAQHDPIREAVAARSGVPGLGEVSAAGWTLARLSLLPGEDLRLTCVDVNGLDEVQVHLHEHDTQTMRRVAGELGFGVDASKRLDLSRNFGRGPFTAFTWESSRIFAGLSLVWYTTRRMADLAVLSGEVTLPPAPAESSR